MIWKCHGIPCFHFYFLFRSNGKRQQVNENDYSRYYGNFFFWKCHSKSTSSHLFSKFFLNNYDAPWQWHLKDNLQLKILRTWINIGVEPAPRHLTYYCMLLFLSNKSCLLPFYLSIFCVCWSSSSTSTLFFITSNKILMKVYSHKVLLYCYFPWNISTC